MPTSDELAPATSASDSDEFIVNQSGISRKITRAQVLSGVQPQIVVPAHALIGNTTASIGGPQAITLGENLGFNGSTLYASASPFVIDGLPSGAVPASGDLVPVSQAGTAVAVTLEQFASGIAAVPGLDLSGALITPNGGAASQSLGQFADGVLRLSGGTLTGSLTLSGPPTSSAAAASKAYIDQQVASALPLSGGSLTGPLTLAAAPQHPLDAVTKSYADTMAAAMLPLAGGTLTGTLDLSGDPTVASQAATKNYADQKLARQGDTLNGVLQLAGDPIAALHAATKNYVDTRVATALPISGGTLSGSLVLASDPTSNGQAATKQYVDQRVLRNGDTLIGPLFLAADPAAPGQAATKNYVDIQASASVARSGGSMTGALLLVSDPASPLQASTKQYVDLRVNRAGDSLTGSLYLAADPVAPRQAATKSYIDAQIAGVVTPAGATFTGPVLLAGVPTSPAEAATKLYADAKIARTGDTLTGTLILAGDPTLPAQAATKNYVDTRISTALPLTGGSLAGALTLAGDPSIALQAASKRYVDTQIATALPLSGGTLAGTLTLAGVPATAGQAANKQYVDAQIGTALATTGGTLSGPLTLAGLPTQPLQAAPKSYVDANPNSQGMLNVSLPPFEAKIDGVTDDTAAFKAAYQSAAAGATIYVPSGTTVLQQPGTWGVPLTKRVHWVVAGTTLPDGTPLAAAIPTGGGPASLTLPGLVSGNSPTSMSTSQGSSQATDYAVNSSSYIVGHNGGTNGAVIANTRADTIIYNSPGNYVWNGLDRLIWSGIGTPNSTTPAQHVGRYVQTIRESVSTNSSGQALPQPQMWGACIEYRDNSGQPSSATNASLTMEMDWFGNGADDANVRTIQSLVIGQSNTAGPPVELFNIIGFWLAGGSSGSTKNVLFVAMPYSNAVLDTTNAQSINNAPVIKMAAGQAIAFEATNTNRLLYDSSTSTLRWNEGSLSYPVGKGIALGWVYNYTTSATIPSYYAGNMILLQGSTPYTITLPAANSVGAGTGFTFSVTGTANVVIQTSGSDLIDSGPIVLYPHDRYSIVSDGNAEWYEVFRSNAVSPVFQSSITLPSYIVAGLPAGLGAGAKVFASNGRKPGEAAGSGTGVEVFFDGKNWISSCSGVPVAA